MSQHPKWSSYVLLMLVGAVACAVALAACSSSSMPEATATAELPWEGPAAPVEITFVDIAGFLIECGGKKILVDAFSMMFPKEVRTLLEQAAPPFDGVDLILTTHNHSDHFHPQLVGPHLEQSPDTVFVSTEQAVAQLQKAFPALRSDRLRAFEPKEGERLQATVKGVDLEMLNLPHGVPLTNLAFVIHIGGRKLLHTGDFVDVTDIEAYGLAGEGIDVAFVPHFYLIEEQYLSEDGQSPMLEAIQAQHIVPMHLATTTYGREHILQELATRYPEAILFSQALETHIVE